MVATCIYMAESSDVRSSLAKYITNGYVAIVNWLADTDTFSTTVRIKS